ncbi:hypothetical protein [Arenibaculum pallidiluteum]|uniref:hypothetical protein n=1 Tax=Arenibaculum pallidiluteum TaxID=2812559 RepID=UPI001A95F1BD|nr:hypothetical protein [Arenibaculum pallidiluteum]
MTLSEILARANAGSVARNPGQWTPVACEIWRAGPPDVTDLIYGALVWEQKHDRLARPENEPEIRAIMAKVQADTAAAQA